MTAPDRRPASLRRRILPAALLGGASVVFVLALDRPATTDELSTEPLAESAPNASPNASPNTAGAEATSPSTTTPSRQSSPSTTTRSTVPATPTCDGDEVTGPSVSTKFGPVQVAATIADDGTICAVDTVEWPDGDRKSQSINQRAVPTLEQRTIQAQSAEINAVSGATITSRAYVQSLQAILDG